MIMLGRSGIVLAAMLVVGAPSHATAQGIVLHDTVSSGVRDDIAARRSTQVPVASRRSPKSSQARSRQSRNAGLSTDWGGAQPPEPRYGSGGVLGSQVGDDNYRNWHQACCL
jgi:hypothetical protein